MLLTREAEQEREIREGKNTDAWSLAPLVQFCLGWVWGVWGCWTSLEVSACPALLPSVWAGNILVTSVAFSTSWPVPAPLFYSPAVFLSKWKYTPPSLLYVDRRAAFLCIVNVLWRLLMRERPSCLAPSDSHGFGSHWCGEGTRGRGGKWSRKYSDQCPSVRVTLSSLFF